MVFSIKKAAQQELQQVYDWFHALILFFMVSSKTCLAPRTISFSADEMRDKVRDMLMKSAYRDCWISYFHLSSFRGSKNEKKSTKKFKMFLYFVNIKSGLWVVDVAWFIKPIVISCSQLWTGYIPSEEAIMIVLDSQGKGCPMTSFLSSSSPHAALLVWANVSLWLQ